MLAKRDKLVAALCPVVSKRRRARRRGALQVRVMARPPIFWGGTCSFSVACDPQIGQLSNKRGGISCTWVINTSSPTSLGRVAGSRTLPSFRAKVKKWGGLLGTATG